MNDGLAKKLEEFNKERNKVTWRPPINIIPIPSSIEDFIKLDAYKELLEAGRLELHTQIKGAGVEIKTDLHPFKTNELQCNVKYVLSKFAWIVIYGIEMVNGVQMWSMCIPEGEDTYAISSLGHAMFFLLPMPIIVSQLTDFVLRPDEKLYKDDKISYKIVGEGYNNPKMQRDNVLVLGDSEETLK